MRVLFSTVPGYGHLLPLAPLMEAAIGQAHHVGLLAGDDLRPIAAEELPATVELLPTGRSMAELTAEAARRLDGDPFHPTPAMVGEMFGGTRLALDGEAALAAARAWRPDVVVADAYDSVGPLVAAVLGVPWHKVGLGPGLDPSLEEEIARSTAPRYERAGLLAVAPTTYVDPCPAVLQQPGWRAPAPTLRMRARAHRRPTPGPTSKPDFADPGKPTVLLTLGTVFASGELLASLASALAGADVNVVATLGPDLSHPPVRLDPGTVEWVGFVPLDELLDLADLVVAAGGSGTVLAAMSRGVPMVIWPQGADQHITAERAESAGVAILAHSVTEVAAAVERAVASPALRARADEVRDDIAAAPSVDAVVADLLDGAASRTRLPSVPTATGTLDRGAAR